ncbi:uncharacterized protein LOC105775351 [Gossypium raimondii]|uniref:uncharacterized protein LOC105775351 n=1 Tax=Gossypium raimondii TaxID=29730 RepID=UPI00227C1444|nr:uncharacterized protein LOC105775351 [Gossypium raimondii]
MFLLPGLVITLYATGALNTVLSKDHQYEICRFLYNHQASNVHCVNLLSIFDPDRCLEHMNGQGIIHYLQKYGYVLTFFLFIQTKTTHIGGSCFLFPTTAPFSD